MIFGNFARKRRPQVRRTKKNVRYERTFDTVKKLRKAVGRQSSRGSVKGQRTPSCSINQRIGNDTLRELFLRIHTICRISPFRYRAWSELRLAAWSCDCLDALRAVKRSVHRKAARADIVCPVQLVIVDQFLSRAHRLPHRGADRPWDIPWFIL